MHNLDSSLSKDPEIVVKGKDTGATQFTRVRCEEHMAVMSSEGLLSIRRSTSPFVCDKQSSGTRPVIRSEKLCIRVLI